MAGIGYAIGDHRGEKRLNRAERGNREGRSHQIAHRFERDRWEMKTRQSRRNAAEPAIDRRDWPSGEVRDRRGNGYRDDTGRHAFG